MDFLKVLRAFLADVYKMPVGEIDALLAASDATDDTVLAAILARDKTRIENLTKPKSGQTFQDGYKKAKAEVLAAFEKEVREKFGLDEDETKDLTGLELIAKVIEVEAPEAGKKSITDDTIKKHPLYLKLEKDTKKALNDVKTEWEKKLADKDKEFGKAQVFSSVKGKALEIFTGLNPVLSTNAKVANNQQADFLRTLEGYTYEAQADGSFLIMDGDKRLEDGHGNPITLDELVKQKAGDRFDFKANNGGENPGGDGKDKNKNDGKNKTYPAGVTKPKTLDDLAKLMNDDKVKTADKSIIMETWEAENPNS